MKNRDDSKGVSDRFIRLALTGDAVHLVGGHDVEELPLPLVPASRIDWLQKCATRFWRTRRRCLAALLMMNASDGRWTLDFPRQSCREDGVRWAVAAGDLVDLERDWLVGGTFQSVAVATENAGTIHLDGLVPASDGLHFVLLLGDKPPGELRAFVRAGGELRPAVRERILLNDWLATIDGAMPRLTLA